MRRTIISAILTVCMLCIAFAPSYAADPAVVSISAEKGSGTFYMNKAEGGREKVEINDAIIVSVTITNCEEADVCSGIIYVHFDEYAVSCVGYRTVTGGTWEVNDKTEGAVRMAFSKTDAIEDGVVMMAAFVKNDEDADTEITFRVTVEELLTGDVIDGDVPCEYYIATEYATYTDEEPVEPTNPPTDYLIGDADDNGVVNSADATWVLKYAAEIITNPTERQFIQADVTFDKQVKTDDATKILKYVAEIITEF